MAAGGLGQAKGFLLESGSDRTIRDGEAKTSLDLARASEARWEGTVAAGTVGFPTVPRMGPEEIAAMLAGSLGQAKDAVREPGASKN